MGKNLESLVAKEIANGSTPLSFGYQSISKYWKLIGIISLMILMFMKN